MKSTDEQSDSLAARLIAVVGSIAGVAVVLGVVTWYLNSPSSDRPGSPSSSSQGTAVDSSPDHRAGKPSAEDLSARPAAVAVPLATLDGAGGGLRGGSGSTPQLNESSSASHGGEGLLNEASLGGIAATLPPPLEQERQKQEAAGSESSAPITIETGFECSPKMEVKTISPTHLSLLTQSPYWFMFRVHGVAGKTVRFDIVNPGVGLRYWSTLNPVFSSASNLDDAKAYTVDEKAQAAVQEQRAWNGSVIPSTAGQSWHFIVNAWQADSNQFSFVQRFDSNDNFVAMRVPYTPTLSSNMQRAFGPDVSVEHVVVGHSRSNRPLDLFIIGQSDRTTKPCMLIYGREHASENDSSWVVEGALKFLSSSSMDARNARAAYTFIIVPVLDPDGAAAGDYVNITDSFQAFQESAESTAYSKFFRSWVVDHGNRLDLILNIHNVQSSEGGHLGCALTEPPRVPVRFRACQYIGSAILDGVKAGGFDVGVWKPMQSYFSFRLGGWLMGYYGPIHLLFEVNSQGRDRHLNIDDTERLGELICRSAASAFTSFGPSIFEDGVKKTRLAQNARWAQRCKRYGRSDDAILDEYKALMESNLSKDALSDPYMLE